MDDINIPASFSTRVKLDEMLTGVVDDNQKIQEISNYILSDFKDGCWCEIMNLITIHACVFLKKIQIFAKIVQKLIENNYFDIVEFYTVGDRERSLRLLYYLHKNGVTSIKQLVQIYNRNPRLINYFPGINNDEPSDEVPQEIEFLVENIFPKNDFKFKIFHGEKVDISEEYGFLIDIDEDCIGLTNAAKKEKIFTEKIKNPYFELPRPIRNLNTLIEYFGDPETRKYMITTLTKIYNRTIQRNSMNFPAKSHLVLGTLNYRIIISYAEKKFYTDFYQKSLYQINTLDSLPVYLYYKETNHQFPIECLAKEGANTILNYMWEHNQVFDIDVVYYNSILGNNLPMIRKLEKFADLSALNMPDVIRSNNVDLVKHFHKDLFYTLQYYRIKKMSEFVDAYLIENSPDIKNLKDDVLVDLIIEAIKNHKRIALNALSKNLNLDKGYMNVAVENKLIQLSSKKDWRALKCAADAGLKARFASYGGSIISSSVKSGDKKTVQQAVRLNKWASNRNERVAEIVERVDPELASKIRNNELNKKLTE